MAKQDKKESYWSSFSSVALYKRTQGRIARQLTVVGLGLIIFYGLWTLSTGPLADYDKSISVGIPTVLAVIAAWGLFRLYHWPRFADFLIAVEAEMDKVSWPTKDEVHRSTIVVLGTMFFLGFMLFFYDVFWQKLFQAIGILKIGTGG